MDIEGLYLRLPWHLQGLILNFAGAVIHRRRYSGHYGTVEKEVDKRLDFSKNEIHKYRVSRLKKHFQSARSSPFWANRFLKFKVNIGSEDPFKELEKLPVLTKLEVKEHASEIVNYRAKSRSIKRHTSGSTGSGLIFWESRQMEQVTWATWWRFRKMHGISRHDWCAYFGGRSIVSVTREQPPFWRNNFFGKQIIFSGYHINSATAEAYLTKIKKTGVSWIHGYPSIISLLAGYKKELNISLPRLKIITTGAENLLESQKRLISEAFQVPLAQHYGLAEGVANISMWPSGSMHVDEDYACVEFLPLEGGNEKQHKIVGTNWHNHSFPLFRYDTGDIVSLADSKEVVQSCRGRKVEFIDGRREDFVVLPNGTKIGRMDNVFKDLINIKDAQIRQKDKSRITILVVPGIRYSQKDERLLVEQIKKRLGDTIGLEIKYMSSIKRTKSGKLRLVVQE